MKTRTFRSNYIYRGIIKSPHMPRERYRLRKDLAQTQPTAIKNQTKQTSKVPSTKAKINM